MNASWFSYSIYKSLDIGITFSAYFFFKKINNWSFTQNKNSSLFKLVACKYSIKSVANSVKLLFL